MPHVQHVLAAIATSPVSVHNPFHINDATWIALLVGMIIGVGLDRRLFRG